MPSLPDLLPFLLLGALLGLDVVSVPQAMISRPIVGATLAGLLAGEPLAGVATGAALECLALETLPFGASRYPEWGSASVVGGVVAVQGAGGALPVPGAWVTGVVAAIATAWFGGWTMVQHRRRVGRLAAAASADVGAGDARAVTRLQLAGVGLDALRALVLTTLGLALALPLAQLVARGWALAPLQSRAALVTVVAAVAASAVWKLLHGFSGTRRLFLAGLFVGTVLVVWRG